MTVFIPGTDCNLRPLSREDLDGPWGGWLNDPNVTRYMIRGGGYPIMAEENAAFYESIVGSVTDLELAIDWHGKHVGNIGLHHIELLHRTAELGILIGAQSAWGRGIGTEATRLVCRHGFDRLNLHRIELGVLADNARAIRCYEKVGFKHEGRLREAICRDGKRTDKLVMGLLPHELT